MAKVSEQEVKRLMKEFCNIIMPGHNKQPGYINVNKKVKDLGVDRRTYYHWKNGECIPRLKDFVARLNTKGYTIQIVPDYGVVDKLTEEKKDVTYDEKSERVYRVVRRKRAVSSEDLR